MGKIEINEEEMDTAIETLNSSIDAVVQCCDIIASYQAALEEMNSKYLKTIDEIDVMAKEANQLLEAVDSAVTAITSVNNDIQAQDNEGKKIEG